MKQSLDDYIKSLRGKRVAVVGIGVSNWPLVHLLASGGVEVTALDRRDPDALGEEAKLLEKAGVTLALGADYLEHLDHEIIFRTPGLHPNTPQIKWARENGAVITSEMEVFFTLCPCRIIGVTGSDGKTTTTTLITELLKTQGFCCHLGGNIGRPLLANVPKMKAVDFAVLELSSFQLMGMTQSPDIAVVTNVSPNHLDVHSSMEEYIGAKENIFRHQNADGTLIVNLDNEITRAMAGKANGKVLGFSCEERVACGAYLSGQSIFFAEEEENETLLNTKDILLPGRHNVENYMAAICATRGLVSRESIAQVAGSFPGVEHRIEFVRELRGVKFYNSSIDSSPTRTAAALRSFEQRTIVICGGYDKKIPFEPLGEVLVEKAKAVVLVGATADKIELAVKDTPEYDPEALPIFRHTDFEAAVKGAADIAEKGDVVILSPACASFDLFDNFAQRGDAFKQIVKGLS